jgi:hypothetical protein
MAQEMSSFQTLLFAVAISTGFGICLALGYFIVRKFWQVLLDRAIRKGLHKKTGKPSVSEAQ